MKTAVSLWSVIFAVLAAVLGVCAAVIEVSLDYTNWWAVGAAAAAGISAVLGGWAVLGWKGRAPDDDEAAKPPQLVAIRMLGDAEEYVEAARQLTVGSGPIILKWPWPIYHLLCHATELTLKAYLAASGVPIKTLVNRIGHDLKLALRRAQKLGFAPPDTGFSEVVQRLAPYHLDHSFRYSKADGSVSHPESLPVADIITDTIKAIEPYVRRQYEKMNERPPASIRTQVTHEHRSSQLPHEPSNGERRDAAKV